MCKWHLNHGAVNCSPTIPCISCRGCTPLLLCSALSSKQQVAHPRGVSPNCRLTRLLKCRLGFAAPPSPKLRFAGLSETPFFLLRIRCETMMTSHHCCAWWVHHRCDILPGKERQSEGVPSSSFVCLVSPSAPTLFVEDELLQKCRAAPNIVSLDVTMSLQQGVAGPLSRAEIVLSIKISRPIRPLFQSCGCGRLCRCGRLESNANYGLARVPSQLASLLAAVR